MRDEAKIPIRKDIQDYLRERNPLGLKGANVILVGNNNHLIYRVKHPDSPPYAIRMINPESHRKNEWLSMEEEYEILKAVTGTGRVPRVYIVDSTWNPPLMIQEWIPDATPFSEIATLKDTHIQGVAEAIADINGVRINPGKFPFIQTYSDEQWVHPRKKWRQPWVWWLRLFDAARRTGAQKDVLYWIRKISPLILQVNTHLSKSDYLFKDATLNGHYYLHFDGAHTGNVYWQNERVMLLDWQKVSLRHDPTFTLVRFAASVGKKKGYVNLFTFQALMEAYLSRKDIKNFREMAYPRLLERLLSDLVWCLWEYSRIEDGRSVEKATSVVSRYHGLIEMFEFLKKKY